MGRINIEIPDELHDELRAESHIEQVPIKMIAIRALREHTDDSLEDIDLEQLSIQ